MDHYPGTEYPLTKKKKVRKEISLQKKKKERKKSLLNSSLLGSNHSNFLFIHLFYLFTFFAQ